VAAALGIASAAAAWPSSAGPTGSWRDAARPGAVASILGKSWVELEAGSVALPAPESFGRVRGPQVHIAGATLRNLGGWSASLFVTRASADAAADDESLRIPDSTAVNARLARRIFRHTTLTLDAFNLFDRRAHGVDELVASQRWSQGGTPEDFLVHPGEGRGVRLGIRWTFR
jgi:outer membrane receptor protein involved in Fe transport